MRPFDDQPTLSDGRFQMRPLAREDFPAHSRAASDPAIWALHPASDRWKPEVFRGYFDFLIDVGGTLALIDSATGAFIGCSRYYPTPDIADSISIGFTFLVRDHWGGATNRAMKSLMLAHAFKTFDEVWLHVNMGNIRSQKATLKIAEHRYDAPIDVGRGPVQMKCYCITREAWMAQA